MWPFQISRFLITLTTKGSFFLTYWNEISYRSRNNRNNTSSPIFKYLFLFLSNFLWGGPCNILPHTSRHSNWYIRNFLLVCKFQLDKKLTPNDILKILSFTTEALPRSRKGSLCFLAVSLANLKNCSCKVCMNEKIYILRSV